MPCICRMRVEHDMRVVCDRQDTLAWMDSVSAIGSPAADRQMACLFLRQIHIPVGDLSTTSHLLLRLVASWIIQAIFVCPITMRGQTGSKETK
jgi:hypothetical protein